MQGYTMSEYVEQKAALPRWVEVTVVAQDPEVKVDGHILTATVRTPADWLEPGPRTHRFHVVDYNATEDTLSPPAGFAGADADNPLLGPWTFADRLRGPDGEVIQDDERLRADFAFHAQNVYAIAARTLAAFEQALGRRVPWSFPGHQLYLVPHAFAEANAYYAAEDHAIYFGYFPGIDGRRAYSCLSHDIIAHETTHAVLDGMRSRFEEPGLPDQAAFHEAFADIVALLSVFSMQEVVQRLLGDPVANGRIPNDRVSPEALQSSALFQLAEEMGGALYGRGTALRRSVRLAPFTGWRDDLAYDEPHLRGEILVAAVMQTMLRMWSDRLQALLSDEGIDLARAAEEGAKSADHLLKMLIRSIDFTPPVEFEFEDFLEAVLASDQEIAPDDEHNYRGALKDAFAAFGIAPPQRETVDFSSRTAHPLYDHVNFNSLRSDCDEVFRFLWENAGLLGINRGYYTQIDEVWPAVRIGPDGFIVSETVATYVQSVEATAAELLAIPDLGLKLPDGLDGSTPIRMWGGGTLIFDQFGRAKFHQSKPLLDGERQSRRLAYLARAGAFDTRARLGFSDGTQRGQRFAELHRSAGRALEEW